MNLGPGTLDATLDVDNNTFSADLDLPPATGSFTELGFLPVTATTEFIQDGPTTGAVDGDTGGIVEHIEDRHPAHRREDRRHRRSGRQLLPDQRRPPSS